MDIKNFLSDYVACKSVSSDNTMIVEMEMARKHLLKFFHTLSIEAEEISTSGHAVVFAQTKQMPDRPTILIYGHYDVQPAEDCILWETDPFVLSERNGRLYGRGASDNKGGHSAILAAISDLLSAKKDLPVNLKFILEGEEEIGSRNIPDFLRKMKDKLSADFALVADTWSMDDNHIVITSGLRGLVGCEVELVGQSHDLHSGYGGCILNPIQALVDICSGLHTSDGKINIDHFYDDVVIPDQLERSQISRLAISDNDMKNLLGTKFLHHPHSGFSAAETMRFFPTLEFNGISGGFQGDGIKTVIPCRASVKISCRLVANQNYETIKNLLENRLRQLCPSAMNINIKFEQFSNPYLLNKHNNEALKTALSFAEDEIKNIFGHPPTYLRDGGSIGLVTMLKEILGMESILIGLSTSQDNVHAPNESISISMLEKGRKFFQKFFSRF